MADFHFLFVSWSFALKWSLQCLLFRLLRRGFIHALGMWNSWKVLVKNWLSVVIHNNITSWREWEIVICMELPGILLSPLLWCNATWLFLWFYFLYKLIHFQSENTLKKVVLPNILKQGAFFFPSRDWLHFFQLWPVFLETRAQAPTASSIERLECLR